MSTKNFVSKPFYTFDEVCEIVGIRPYVLRFWETEFVQIKSEITELGIKNFELSVLNTILQIKKLLFEDKLTIERAKSMLDSSFAFKNDEESTENLEVIESENINKLTTAKNNLRNILKDLERLQKGYNI